jgi:hypothetical protein
MGRTYQLPDGSEVPSVTTILQHLGWKSFGLMHWAHKLGREGKSLKGEREAVCNAGSLAHEFAHCNVTGRTWLETESEGEARFTFPPGEETPGREFVVPLDVAAKARASFASFRNWRASSNLVPVAPEAKVWSVKHRYAGRLDLIATLGDEADLIDFKSSKALYADHLIQLAAYRAAWEEMYPDLPIKRCRVLRWGDDGDFHESVFENTEAAFQIFLRLRDIHELKTKLPKAA